MTDANPFFAAPRSTGYGLFDIEGQYGEAAWQAGPGTDLAPIALGTLGDTGHVHVAVRRVRQPSACEG